MLNGRLANIVSKTYSMPASIWYPEPMESYMGKHNNSKSIGSIPLHKIAKINGRFHSGDEDCSRLYRVSHANAKRPGHFFPGCVCSFQSNNPLPEKCKISPGIKHVIPLQYTTHLYSFAFVNNALFVVESSCATMSSDQIYMACFFKQTHEVFRALAHRNIMPQVFNDVPTQTIILTQSWPAVRLTHYC